MQSVFYWWSGRRLMLILTCGLFVPALWGCFGPPLPPVADGDSAVGRPVDVVGDPDATNDPVVDAPMDPPMEEPIRPVVEDPGMGGTVTEPAAVETADLTDDGVIDKNDVDAFAGLFGSSSDAGAGEFNPAADFDGDGSITLVDFQMFLDLLAEPQG